MGTGHSSQYSHGAISESSSSGSSQSSSQFVAGASTLAAIGAFQQPARHFIDFDSAPPMPTGKMSLQESVRQAGLAAKAAPISTGARLRAAANASRIAADQLRLEAEAVKARRDQELADQARQDTIRRKLEDDRRLDELAKEKIREFERLKEVERARVNELEKAAIRTAMIAREKRDREVKEAELWRAEHEKAERTRKALEAGIDERRRRESLAIEEKIELEQRAEREKQEGRRRELLEAEARRLGYLRAEKERLVQKQRRESVTATATTTSSTKELHSYSSSSSSESVQRDVSRGRTSGRDQAIINTSSTSASGEHAAEERGRKQTWTQRQIQLAAEAKAQETTISTAQPSGTQVVTSTEKLESTSVVSSSDETEENRLSRTALERQKAELESMIAEAKKRSVKDRRRRERSSDEYKKKERRRQRDSSRDREAERAEARKQEVEYVRKKLGLGPIVKDTPDEKKKAITFTDEEKEAMIDRFGTWENWTGRVPRLIETPPTPRFGAAMTVPVVHCEGSDYFGGATHEPSSAPETVYPVMTAPGTPSISISGPDDVPDLPSLGDEPEIVTAELEIVVAEPDFGDDFAPTDMPPFVAFNPVAGIESNHGNAFVPAMPAMPSSEVFYGPELPSAGVVGGENASYYSGQVAQEVKKSEETARVAQYHRQVGETTETQRAQVEHSESTGGSRQEYYTMAKEVDQQLEQIKSADSKKEEEEKEKKEKHERWSGGFVEGTKGSEKFRAPGIPSVAAAKPSIAPVMSVPQVLRVAESQQQHETVDVERRTSFGSYEEKTERKSLDSERERLQHILKRTESASTKSETASLYSLDSNATDQHPPSSPEDAKKEPKKPSRWGSFWKEKTPAAVEKKKGTLGWYAAAQKLKDATSAAVSTSSIPEASASASQGITPLPVR